MIIFLIVVGLLLIYLNTRALLKDKNSFSRTLNDKKENIQQFQIELGQLRREFAETLIEIQNEVHELKDKIEEKKNTEYNDEENKIEVSIDDFENDNKSVPKEESLSKRQNNIKVNEIDKMIKDGMSIEEVAEKLQIGKGEILLIKELYLK